MILVYIEEREGKVKKYSLEALSEAKRRADELKTDTCAVLLGHDIEGLAAELFPYGASKVYILDNPLLGRYSPSGFTVALASLIEETAPHAVFFAASSLGRDLAPRLAGRLGVGLASDCIKIEVEADKIQVVRPIFAGKILATLSFRSSPVMATLRPNIFPLMESTQGSGEVVRKDVVAGEDDIKDQVGEILKEEGAELDVTEAEIIVSGGRGMKEPESFELLKELASVLPHAAVGASRSAVDSGWIDHQHQVGQTGKTVSPNLYFAFGISGAIQHVAGMSSSKVIIAVNKDPEAPIFKVADFGIVGDLFLVVPHLKNELEKALSD